MVVAEVGAINQRVEVEQHCRKTEVDGMSLKLVLLSNVSLIQRRDLRLPGRVGPWQCRIFWMTCWPVPTYIADPFGAPGVGERIAVPKRGI